MLESEQRALAPAPGPVDVPDGWAPGCLGFLELRWGRHSGSRFLKAGDGFVPIERGRRRHPVVGSGRFQLTGAPNALRNGRQWPDRGPPLGLPSAHPTAQDAQQQNPLGFRGADWRVAAGHHRAAGSGYSPCRSPGRASGRRRPGLSIINLPTAGCWQLNLQWSGHSDRMELSYLSDAAD